MSFELYDEVQRMQADDSAQARFLLRLQLKGLHQPGDVLQDLAPLGHALVVQPLQRLLDLAVSWNLKKLKCHTDLGRFNL